MKILESDNIKEITATICWICAVNPGQVFDCYWDRHDRFFRFLPQSQSSWYGLENNPRYLQLGPYTANPLNMEHLKGWIEEDIYRLKSELYNMRIPSSLGKKADEIRQAFKDE